MVIDIYVRCDECKTEAAYAYCDKHLEESIKQEYYQAGILTGRDQVEKELNKIKHDSLWVQTTTRND